MPNLGLPELLVIFVIIVVLFGSTRLPQLGEGLGKGIRNFRKGLKGDEDEPRRPERLEEKSDTRNS